MTFRILHKWAPIFALPLAILPQHAKAAASAWEETDGARLRVVAEPATAGETSLRGMLQIELEPGWKTYWREPGAAGIPPSITTTTEAVSGIAIHYPAPEWHDDPYGSWAGYSQPVSLPLTFALSGDGRPDTIEVDVFLGICRDICVPVGARFEVPVDEEAPKAMQALLLDAAFSALPSGNSDRLAVERAEWSDGGALEVAVRHSGSEADLFVSAGADHPFGKPERVSDEDGVALFRVEPSFDPAGMGKMDIVVTARSGIDAVEAPFSVSAP